MMIKLIKLIVDIFLLKAVKNIPAIFLLEELCERVLKYYSFPNDVVLDPFAGSGTFGRVAYKMGKIPVLCELNDDYIKEILNGDIDYGQVF